MNLNINIPEQFKPLFDPKITTIVEPSGRSSGKSTTNEQAAVLDMIASKYNNIWYCRAEKGDIRSTIFQSFISTYTQMGLDSYFTASLSPIEITCKSGAKCYFSGINGKVDDDLNATKGFTPQFKTLKRFILDEANEVKHPNHIDGAETTANKFLLPDSKIIYAYNPPPVKTHWAHEYFGNKVKTGATRIYTTWQDILHLLNEKTIAQIERDRINDPDFYRYWYLGEIVNLSGMVYKQFKRERHCVNIYELFVKGDRIVELILGLDEGTANDSTCVTALAVMASGKAVVLDLYEHCPKVLGQLSPSEQSRALTKWRDELFAKFPGIAYLPRLWYFECAEGGQMLKLQFEQDSGEPCALVQNKSIWGDIKRVRTMLSEDILLFHVADNVNTLTLVQDIEAYIIDPKTNDIKKDQRDDSIDSLEYATKLYYDRPMT